MKIYAKIRFIWDLLVIGITVSVFMVPLLYIAPNRRVDILHYFNRVILFLIGGKLKKIGNIDKEAKIFVMNHQSVVDIIAMEALDKIDYCWVAKKELFEIPWIGKVLSLSKMISVDRSNKSEMVKLLKRSKEVLNEGRVIAIFPEGTRRKGDKFLPFKIGTKILAEKLNVKIQPIVIVGSKEIIDEHKKEARGGEVKLIFLDSFYPKDAKSSWYEDLKDKMERVYFENLNKRS